MLLSDALQMLFNLQNCFAKEVLIFLWLFLEVKFQRGQRRCLTAEASKGMAIPNPAHQVSI